MPKQTEEQVSILLVDSDPERSFTLCLELPAHVIETSGRDLDTVARLIESENPTLVVLRSVPPPCTNVFEAGANLRKHFPNLEIILILDRPDDVVVLQALRADVQKEFKGPLSVSRLAKWMISVILAPPNQSAPDDMLGSSKSMQQVRELIHRVARTDATVLITGETGTGKELAARAIHRFSSRSNEAMVCVNCTAIPDTLLESELFGFEKGAFTGATARQDGKLKQADRGTVFLDEIGDMSAMAQAKILRTIESREIQPLGGTLASKVDLRIVAATHCDLQQLVVEKRFREDLFFRLNVVPIHMPPLRERLSDLPSLLDHFIEELNVRYGRSVQGVTPAGLRLLYEHDWPGNVRQLRNVIEGAFVVCSSDWITTADLRWLHWSSAESSRVEARVVSPTMSHLPVVPEPDRLLSALQATHWNKSKTAQLLRWSRMTVYRKIAKYQLRKTGTEV